MLKASQGGNRMVAEQIENPIKEWLAPGGVTDRDYPAEQGRRPDRVYREPLPGMAPDSQESAIQDCPDQGALLYQKGGRNHEDHGRKHATTARLRIHEEQV